MIRARGDPSPQQGRKPRASGDDPSEYADYSIENEVNPARAGMIRVFQALWNIGKGKPRASGDDPVNSTCPSSCRG